MNRTQKAAWVSLAITVLLIAFSINWIIMVLAAAKPSKSALALWFSLLWIITGLAFILFRRKQSPDEVDFDERDKLIKRKAVYISYISVWLLLITAGIVPNFIVGDSGSIPVSALIPIFFLVFLLVTLIWSVAILIQYSRGAKGEKS